MVWCEKDCERGGVVVASRLLLRLSFAIVAVANEWRCRRVAAAVELLLLLLFTTVAVSV